MAKSAAGHLQRNKFCAIVMNEIKKQFADFQLHLEFGNFKEKIF